MDQSERAQGPIYVLKRYKRLKSFYQFCDNCKILSYTFYLKEDKMKIAMFAHFKEYHGKHKKV